MNKLFISALVLLTFTSNGFTQTIEQGQMEWEQRQKEWEEKAKTHKRELLIYYRNSSAKQIWRDYLDLRSQMGLTPAGIAGSSEKFKEPFKSWVIEEISKINFSSHELAVFLVSDYQEKHKKEILEKFLDNNLGEQQQFYVSPAEVLASVVLYLEDWSKNYYDERVKRWARLYQKVLSEKLLNNYNLFDLSNNSLCKILPFAPKEKQAQIFNFILNNNPSDYDLGVIIDSKIEYYSDLAKQALLAKFMNSSDNDPDLYWLRETKLEFLKEKMINWPN